MITSQDITDTYGTPADGLWLRRWDLRHGQPRCPLDAVPLDDPTADAVRARNAAVRQAVEAVEAYEAAARLTAGLEPPETLTSAGLDGESITAQNPAWTAWQAALETLATASPRTRALALVRLYGDMPPPAELDGAPNPARADYDAAVAALEV